MPCTSPLRGVRGDVNALGRRPLDFSREAMARSGSLICAPCGQCASCRLEYSRQWACRCMDESRMWKENSFVTLTFDEVNLKDHGPSLARRDMQLFMKRLRKQRGVDIRFYGCGEYGTRYGRPHYHLLLFNLGFSDQVFYKVNALGDRMYNSASLAAVWPYGYSVVGGVTFESAAYVSRYMMDRVTETKQVKDEFGRVTGRELTAKYIVKYLDKATGELLEPEFSQMSRGGRHGMGGIGRPFYEKFKFDMYPHDCYIRRGIKMMPPKFYDGLLEKEDPGLLAELKRKRFDRVDFLDNTDARLAVKDVVLRSRLKLLSRSLEV